MRYISSVLVALFMLALIGCTKGSPLGPTPNPKPGPQPHPAPGMSVHSIPLPDTDEPLLLWIEKIEPGENGQLIIGQPAYVQWTCGGPSGYILFIGGEYLKDGLPEQGPQKSGGSSVLVKSMCDATARSSLAVNASTSNVRAFRFYIWVAQGNTIGFPYKERPPDAVLEEPLDWKAPAK